MFLLGYLLLKYRCDVASTAFKAAVVGAAPLILLLFTWAPVGSFLRQNEKQFCRRYANRRRFFDLLRLGCQPNLAFPSLVLAAMSVLLFPLLALAGRSI